MKLDPPENSNYAVSIIRVPDKLLDLAGLDNLKGFPVFGLQALVSATEFQAGDLVAVLPTEVQLSPDFCKYNNLYRHAELNADTSVKGYLEDNRRVRAIKFRGNRSDALIVPLEALRYTLAKVHELQAGDTFDKLNGQEICHKYVIRIKGPGKGNQPATKKPSRVDARVFPEHIDTTQYHQNKFRISPDTWVYVTQKIHGTSVRVGNVPVRRNLKLRDKVARKVGVAVTEHEHDYVYGSRKVIKDANNPNQAHFYGMDVWTAAGRLIQDVIPKGFIVYGELIGYTGPGGEPIQKHYTYKVPEGTNRLLVYRVAYVNPDGTQFDLSWPQLREWCRSAGLDTVRPLWEGYHRDFNVDEFMDKRYAEQECGCSGYTWKAALPLEDDTKEQRKLVDEGVVVRADIGITPVLLKAKAPGYKQHETLMLDQEVLDLEENQGAPLV